ncbi:MAG: nucleoside-diphosphate kinase [Bryobacteraceae bacterium]|nr:nucleoside-diphosphate kinase [Bryobacteraceae bacterium]
MSQRERTFAIIKPDAVAAGHIGEIITQMERNGFKIVGMRMRRITEQEARGFYEVHKERPFYADLVKFMTEGPVVVLALERENAIAKWREVMGATDPKKAEPGTIRKLFGSSIERNASHGSDGPATAETELGFFFSTADLM